MIKALTPTVLAAGVAGTLAIVLASPQSHAQSDPRIACDSFYTTSSGDSLSSIARRASEPDRQIGYQDIIDFNPGTIRDPNQIPVGLEIFIPCPAGTSVGDDTVEIREATGSDIKILTGSNYPPYVDKGLPHGGFSTHLVEAALQSGDGALNYRIDVINDWSSHLTPLLADGAYDLAYPWFRPDCSQYDKLGENGRWRCDNLRFSEPLHEVVVTYYARAGETDGIVAPADLEDKRICRPTGYFTHDLAVRNLKPPFIVRVAGETPTDCFERLVDGEVDVVTLNADTSEAVIDRLGIGQRVAELVDLATIETLHVVAVKDNPRARPLLLRVDQGLRSLRRSGSVRQIAAAHL